MTPFAGGLSNPEAPVWLPDGDLLVVEMGPERGCVTRIAKDGKSSILLARTGRPNGLALDKNDAIWVAETHMRALLKMTSDGQYRVFATECAGRPFTFLNDVAFGPASDLYLTDSGVALDDLAPGGMLNPAYRQLHYDGRVYRIDTDTASVELIDSGYQFINGLAFGPDGNLYTNETLTGMIYRYPCTNGRVTGKRQVHGNVNDWAVPSPLKGPDGMKFGANGNLYVAVFGQGDVTVLNPEGSVIQRIKTQGSFPSNLVFGKNGESQIFVTEGETGTVQVFDVDCSGFPLHG
jgi:gluconolactonase